LSQYRTAPTPAEAPTCVRCGAKTGSLQDRNDEGLCEDCVKDLEILAELFEAEIKGAIPCSVHGKLAAAYPEGDSWDAPRARVELRKWASDDASGDPATLEWPKFRKGFCLVR